MLGAADQQAHMPLCWFSGVVMVPVPTKITVPAYCQLSSMLLMSASVFPHKPITHYRVQVRVTVIWRKILQSTTPSPTTTTLQQLMTLQLMTLHQLMTDALQAPAALHSSLRMLAPLTMTLIQTLHSSSKAGHQGPETLLLRPAPAVLYRCILVGMVVQAVLSMTAACGDWTSRITITGPWTHTLRTRKQYQVKEKHRMPFTLMLPSMTEV